MSTLLKTKKDKLQFLDWIAALEAEAVPQTKRCLEDSLGMCCLGVAVSLTVEDPLIDVPENSEAGDMPLLVGDVAECQPKAPKWLKDINSDFFDKTGFTLPVLNDQRSLTFPQIAKALMKVYGPELEGVYEKK